MVSKKKKKTTNLKVSSLGLVKKKDFAKVIYPKLSETIQHRSVHTADALEQ